CYSCCGGMRAGARRSGYRRGFTTRKSIAGKLIKLLVDSRFCMSVNVLFVCLGNICRSPTADGIFRHHLQKADWHKRVHVDSAGTSDWHIGRAPDPRTVAAAHKRGYDLSALRGRQVTAADFNDFDYVLAMDKAN